MILMSRSQDTETVAPFFTADTFDRATPERDKKTARVRLRAFLAEIEEGL